MSFTKNTKKNTETSEKINYDIKVSGVRPTKNDSILMVDLVVNGVSIKSCILREIICQKDGELHKKGDVCYVLNFPSNKVGDKYYNQVWFPISNENIADILTQAQSMLG